jgi:hypothetical protein
MVFVGYEKGSKAYQAYDPRTRWVHVTRNAVFDELRSGIGARKMTRAATASRLSSW